MKLSKDFIDSCGTEHGGEFETENGQVGRHFRGFYTILEIEAVLADMKRIEKAMDQTDDNGNDMHAVQS